MRSALYFFVIILSAVSVFGLPGEIDGAFGVSGGYINTDFAGAAIDERTGDSAVQADGKIVVVGKRFQGIPGFDEYLVARFNPDGSVDTTFSGDGYFTYFDGNQYDFANAVAIQADGKIIVAGGAGPSSLTALVFRLNSDGTLDTSFSGDGIEMVPNTGPALSLKLQSDGKIILGTNQDGAGFPVNYRSMVVRLNTDGSLDTTFDVDGRVTVNPSLFLPKGLAVMADGKIVVAGANSSNSVLRDVAVVRLNSNGSFDTSFDGDGVVHTILTNQESVALTVAVQTDNKIIIGGESSRPTTTSQSDPTLIRYNIDGSLDTAFDGDGVRIVELLGNNADNSFNDIALQPDGKIVGITDQQEGIFPFFVRDDFFVVRFNPDGSLDNGFDANGIVKSQWCENGSELSLQSDGKIVAVGTKDRPGTLTYDHGICVQRFDAVGAVDYTFNPTPPNGTATLSFYDSTNVTAVGGLPDGKIIIAGWGESIAGGVTEARLLRLNGDGTLDTTFMNEGTYVRTNSSSSYFYDLIMLGDGSFYAVGELGISGGMVVKFTSAGVPDSSFSGDGVANTTIAARFYGIAIDSDGKPIACGSAGATIRSGRIVRFSTTGTVDSSATNNLGASGNNNEILECGFQSNGNLVVAGYGYNALGSNDFIAVSRHLPTLTVDSTFGVGGVVTTDLGPLLNDRATDLVIQPDNRIVVTSAGLGAGGDQDFAVIRYDSNGALDSSFSENFGSGGIALVNFGLAGPEDEARALLLQPDGQMIVGGSTDDGSDIRFGIAKINRNGSPALGFGTLGRTITNFPNNEARVEALGFYVNDKILAVGKTWNGSDFDFALARYQNELIPTAAAVSVSGRVTTSDGRGIKNALMTLIDKSGTARVAATGSFGYFRFDSVPVGSTYVVSVESKRYAFESPYRFITVDDELSDLSFVALDR